MYGSSRDPGDSKPRLLVVDDEDVMRRMFTRALGEGDCWCASTGSGEEAIELLELQRFDLAVVDKNLPDVSGLEVARQARKSVPPVPVIMVTAYPSDASRRAAEKLGVFSYMDKPLGLDELRQTVRKALASRPASKTSRSVREVSTVPAPQVVTRGSEQGATGLSLLVIEEDTKLRSQLFDYLSRAGYHVVSFRSQHQAEIHALHVGYDVLVARPEILEQARQWTLGGAGKRTLGSLAIVDKTGVGARIEARMIGAQGILATSFGEAELALEVGAAIARMREEEDTDSER